MYARTLGLGSLLFALPVLTACGGGSSDSGGPTTYTVGGTVEGLRQGSLVVLQLNDDEYLTLDHSANGHFRSFDTELEDGAAYEVAVAQHPGNQHCHLSNATGEVAAANVADIQINCHDWLSQESGTTASLRGVAFNNAHYGWVVGSDGTILNTEDGGLTWSSQASGLTGTRIQDVHVHFADNKNQGWAVSESGAILHAPTGHNWESQVTGLGPLYTLFFLDEEQGWATGKQDADLHRQPVPLLRTGNGGEDWAEVDIDDEITGRMKDIFFVDATHGFMGGWTEAGFPGGMMYRTIDGGDSWVDITPDDVHSVEGIWFIDDQRGWIVGYGGAILHTSNAGDDWTVQDSATNETLESVQFLDADRGWAVGHGGVIVTTHDGGDSWVRQTSESGGSWLRGLYAVDSSTAWAVGDHGKIVKLDEAID